MIRRFLTALGLALLFLTGCTASTVALDKFVTARMTKLPVDAISPYFPILVIAERHNGPFDAAIVRHSDLELVDQQFPSRTFLVPEGKEAEVNSRLRTLKIAPRKGEESPVPHRGTVHVESQTPGRQQLVVNDNGATGWENTGWYEATADSVMPAHHSYYAADRTFVAALMVTVPVNLAVWTVGWILVSWRQKRRAH
jgi:hypothetical protein